MKLDWSKPIQYVGNSGTIYPSKLFGKNGDKYIVGSLFTSGWSYFEYSEDGYYNNYNGDRIRNVPPAKKTAYIVTRWWFNKLATEIYFTATAAEDMKRQLGDSWIATTEIQYEDR